MFFWHRRPKYKNEVGELLAGDFYMMVFPDEDPFPTEEVTVRSYDGDGYRCRRIPYPVEGFDTRACLAALRRRQCVALRLEGVGHVVLTNFRDFRLFLMLQRAHRCGVNYVFCAGGGGGYFKILAGGRIQRKIASFIQVGNHGSYAETRGQPCAYDTLYVKAHTPDAAARDALASRLLSSSNATGVSFSDAVRESFSDMLRSIDSIVMVLIISAAALAFVVLYNLTNINICERQKELATIKVLGFHPKEVSAYVYRETVCLSLMGTALGLFFGIFLHRFVVQTAEVDAVMFGREISPLSFVFSAVMTLLFTLLVNLAMARKLRRIDMVESLKAPE